MAVASWLLTAGDSRLAGGPRCRGRGGSAARVAAGLAVPGSAARAAHLADMEV